MAGTGKFDLYHYPIARLTDTKPADSLGAKSRAMKRKSE